MNTFINSTSTSPGVTNHSLSRSTLDSSDKSHVSFRDLQSLLAAPLDDGIDTNSIDDARFRSTSSDDDCGASTSTNDVSLPRSSSKSAQNLHRLSSWAFLQEHHAKHVNSNVPVSLMKKMVKMARDAVVLMEKLEHPVSSSTNHSHTPALPPSAIRFSKALVFLWHKKAGVIGSYAWRYGFVIYQLSPGIWSAPVFLRHGFVSVGATCGFSSGATLYAISDNAGIIPFIRSKTKYISGDFEFTMATKMDTTGVLGDADDALLIRSRFVTMGSHPSMPDVHCLSPEHPKIRKYDVQDSLISCMVDISVKCGVESLDHALNSALYGSDVSARDILDGAVQIPSTMYVVHEYLRKRVSNPSLLLRGTKKLFEEEKARLSVRRGHSTVRRAPMQSMHTDSDDSIVAGSPFSEKRQNSLLFEESQLLDIDLGDP